VVIPDEWALTGLSGSWHKVVPRPEERASYRPLSACLRLIGPKKALHNVNLQGVGCAGGADPDHAEPAVAAALRGENACKVVKAALLSAFEDKEMAVTGELLQQAEALKKELKKVRIRRNVCVVWSRHVLLDCEEVRQSGGEEMWRVEGGVWGRRNKSVPTAMCVCIYGGGGGAQHKSRRVLQLTNTSLCCVRVLYRMGVRWCGWLRGAGGAWCAHGGGELGSVRQV